MKIVHAVSNENGTAKNGVDGDQNGKEIRIQSWYKRTGGWDSYLEPIDKMIAHRAAKIARAIAQNDNFGYDQVDRWSGLEAYPNGTGDFDCSSLVISCYKLGGLDIDAKGYSGDIVRRFLSTGQFVEFNDADHLECSKLACEGGVYVSTGHHVCICVNDTDDDDSSEDEIKVLTAKGSVRIRIYPVTGKTVKILRKGDRETVIGVDESSGWYQVHDGWITNNTRYVQID